MTVITVGVGHTVVRVETTVVVVVTTQLLYLVHFGGGGGWCVVLLFGGGLLLEPLLVVDVVEVVDVGLLFGGGLLLELLVVVHVVEVVDGGTECDDDDVELVVVVELWCGGMEMVVFLQLLWHQSPRVFRSLFPQAPLAQPNKLLTKSWPHWLV